MRAFTGVVLLLTWAAYAQAPPTIKDFLASKHVATTPKALKAALSNPDGMVRGAAGMLLVSDKVPGAAGAVRVALEREHDPSTALNLARTLRVGGDPAGEARIRALCTEPKASDDVQYSAAQELRPDFGEGCVRSLVRMADSPPTNTALVIPALQLLVAEDPLQALAMGPKLGCSRCWRTTLRASWRWSACSRCSAWCCSRWQERGRWCSGPWHGSGTRAHGVR